jgi:ABC-type molybdate transport system substrate-binding protein
MMFWISVFRVLVLVAIVCVFIYFVYKEIYKKEGNIFIDNDFSSYKDYLNDLKTGYTKEHSVKTK